MALGLVQPGGIWECEWLRGNSVLCHPQHLHQTAPCCTAECYSLAVLSGQEAFLHPGQRADILTVCCCPSGGSRGRDQAGLVHRRATRGRPGPAQQGFNTFHKDLPAPREARGGWQCWPSPCPILLFSRPGIVITFGKRGQQLPIPITRCHNGKITHLGGKLKYVLEINVRKEKCLQV